MYTTCACLVSTEVRREHQIPWKWVMVVTVTIWVLRIEPCVREANALVHGAISPAQFLEISITFLMTISWVQY